MRINVIGNKILARYEIIAGAIFVTLGTVILSNKWVDNLLLSFMSFLKGRPIDPWWLGELHSIGEGLLVAGVLGIGFFYFSNWNHISQNKSVLQLGLKWDRLKQNRVVLIMAPVCAIIFIEILITINEFSFSYMGNEADVLPSIMQVADRTWLPNDWYLNLDISYRQVFGLIFGQLVSKLGFEYGAYLGRLIVYLLFAIALYIFFRTLQLRFSFGLLVLFLFLKHQSLVSGEGIVGGLETKTVAYAMVIISLSFFLRKRYLPGFAFAGAAMSFHVLVGIYALFCIIVASILNKSWRSEWRPYIKNSWPLLLTGIFGLWAVIDQLLPQRGIDLNRAWNIYVKIRVPHHVLPTDWNSHLWIVELALATSLFLIMYFTSTSKTARFFAAFALGSVLLFLFGLVIYALGDIPLLRFHWFRFPDVMVPFTSAVLIALFLNDYADKCLIRNSLFERFQRGLQTVLRLLPPLIIASLMVIMVRQTYRLQASYEEFRHAHPAKILLAFDWISKNTPKQALFLVDPSESFFYIYAQRATLVSWKHSPQSAAAILEWYKRIKLCNGHYTKYGYSALPELHANFYKLDEDQIQHIADQYGINYYLGLADQKFSFERVYSDSTYAVYKIK